MQYLGDGSLILQNCRKMGVCDFFAGKNIFVTGGSGFLGKILVEKLLRSCPNVGNIYLLIRRKKGLSAQERWDKIMQNNVFDKLKEKNPENLQKVIILEGDISELKLGISDVDRQTLIQNVNIIYHMAASVRFDVPLKAAILENVRSTREIIELAKELQNLLTFVHVSTTYCNCDKSTVEEKIYPSHGNWKEAIKFVEEADPQVIEAMTLKYIAPHPNTYTYSKSLAEQTVLELCKGQVPTIIIRPSIVISTLLEPFPGWNDNLNGPVGLLSAGGKGLLRICWSDSSVVQDYIAIDVVGRFLLFSVFEKNQNRNLDNIEVYNVSKYNDLPVTAGDIMEMGHRFMQEAPFSQILWYPRPSITKCWYNYYIQVLLFHMLPALFLDILMKIFRLKPMFLTIQRKIYIANNCLSYFLQRNWQFVNDNAINLLKSVSPEETDDFGLEVFLNKNKDDIYEYFKNASIGVGKFIFKDDYSDMEKNRRTFRRMWLLDITVKMCLGILLFWYIFVKHNTFKFFANIFFSYADRL